jgi:hypothetical protein
LKRTRRSSGEIRSSLAATRRELDEDLLDLEERMEDMRPSHMFSRHPALITALGALVGIVVVRNPAVVGRLVTRAAQIGLPFVAKALLKRDMSPAHTDGDD